MELKGGKNNSTQNPPKNLDIVGLVDMSWYIYRSLFASFSEYKTKIGTDSIDTDNLNQYDFTKDQEFMHLFKRGFVGSFKAIKEDYNIPYSNVILCQDCSKKNIWRREIFSEYKLHRMVEKKPHEPDFGTMFQHCFEKIIPKLVDKFDYPLVYHPNCEGDDIIAILTEKFLADGKIVYIFANDGDLKQLVINDNVKLIMMHGIYDSSNINYRYIKFDKILRGDKKDNIPNIHTRCGEKTVEKYWKDGNLLKEKIKEEPEIKDKIDLNKKLQLFEYIPKNIKSEVLTTYEDIKNG